MTGEQTSLLLHWCMWQRIWKMKLIIFCEVCSLLNVRLLMLHGVCCCDTVVTSWCCVCVFVWWPLPAIPQDSSHCGGCCLFSKDLMNKHDVRSCWKEKCKPVSDSLSAAHSNTWLLDVFVSPECTTSWYACSPPFGISTGVCFCYTCAAARSPSWHPAFTRCVCELLFNILPQPLYAVPNTQGW